MARFPKTITMPQLTNSRCSAATQTFTMYLLFLILLSVPAVGSGAAFTTSAGVYATTALSVTVVGDATPIPSTVDLTAEGTLDWVHWGKDGKTSVNRKANVAALIGDLITISSSPRRFNSAARASYAWTDGVPNASANTTTGLFFPNDDDGVEISVPADTSIRTFTVYLGGYKASGQIEISLSDGSSAPFVTTVEDLGGAFDRAVQITYSAASAGQSLTIRYTSLSGSNITLQAATLQGPPFPGVSQAPVLQPVGNKTAVVNTELSFVVQANDPDGPGPLVLSHTELPPGATFMSDPSIEGQGTFRWIPPASAVPGPYSITFRATAGNDEFDDETIQIAVAAEAGAGSMLGDLTVTPLNVNLSTNNEVDWVHWGYDDADSVTRRFGVTEQISNFSPLGNKPRMFLGHRRTGTTFRWTGGPPGVREISSAGLFFSGPGNGFELTAPADTTERTLTVYLGGYSSMAQIEVSLSDGSAPSYVTTVGDLSDNYARTLRIVYSAATASQDVTVRYTKLTDGNVSLFAATLQGPSTHEPQPPVIDPIQAGSAVVNSLYRVTFEARDPDGLSPPVVSHSALPPGAVFVAGTSNVGDIAEGEMRWVPTEAALPGPYFVTFRATDSDGLFTEQTIEIALSATPVEGSLSADVGTTPGFVDLSNEGLLDWVHVGLNARNDQNRKSGVSRSITGLSVFNGINRRFSSTKRPSYGWTDGTPEAAAVTHAGIYTPSKSFNVYAPADGNERTLTVYLGGFKAQGQISVRLSDGSAPAFVTTVEDLNGAFDRALRITYRAGTPGQHTLVVEYNYLSGTNITMQAATLQ